MIVGDGPSVLNGSDPPVQCGDNTQQTLMIIIEYSEATTRQRELRLMALLVMEALLKLVMYSQFADLLQ